MSNMVGITRVLSAAIIAAEAHRNQRRKDKVGTPYINHPITVAALASTVTSDTDIVVAALLHDVVEDTILTLDDVEQFCGKYVADIVGEVTDDKKLPWAERKQAQIDHAPHLSDAAAIVKVADKIANVSDLRSPEASWSLERRLQYATWAAKVVNSITNAPEALVATFNDTFVKAIQYIEEQQNGIH
jgi:guanosine-3',5'-bis(diphosphate) 3'-pyrophosphohydrolase